ncbi:hypothetical protein C5S39_01910, partial [Candidatus Methanophagaceae archaeon]
QFRFLLYFFLGVIVKRKGIVKLSRSK